MKGENQKQVLRYECFIFIILQMFTVRYLLNREKRPLVMGIINCTPDSFYAKSRKEGLKEALEEAGKMISEGADILDIGGESTRPGAQYVEENGEIERVIPLVREICARYPVPVSVDTRKSRVAIAALEAGASIINDVSALRDDHLLAGVVRDAGCDIVLMHRQGTPADMQKNPYYRDAAAEISEELERLAGTAMESGIEKDHIIIDPGIGFGKRLEDNLSIIKNIAFFRKTGFPVLIGHSRKSFIGSVTGREVQDRLAGTLASGLISLINGADILRVHDVGETVDTMKILSSVSMLRSYGDTCDYSGCRLREEK